MSDFEEFSDSSWRNDTDGIAFKTLADTGDDIEKMNGSTLQKMPAYPFQEEYESLKKYSEKQPFELSSFYFFYDIGRLKMKHYRDENKNTDDSKQSEPWFFPGGWLVR